METYKDRVLMNFRVDRQDRRLIRNAAKVRGTTMVDLFRSIMIPKARKIVLAQDENETDE